MDEKPRGRGGGCGQNRYLAVDGKVEMKEDAGGTGQHQGRQGRGEARDWVLW